jgi:hypothetical protein
MLSHSIAITATISPAIMNMASFMSTTTKELTENTANVMTISAQQRQQQAIITRGVARNK